MRTASRLFVRHTKWAPVALIMLASCLLLALGPGAHAAEKPAATQKKFMDRGERGNVYLAGVGLRSPEAVTGDLYAAGCPISVDRPVAKDVVLAGCHIDVTGDVGDDLRAAGGQVTIAGKVGGEAMVAGGRIVLAPGSIIAGRAVLAGGEVTVEGNVAKDLKIYAGKVTIQGEVEGDALVMAQDIEMLSGASIKGNLTYTSRNEIKMDPSAHVLGKITREPTPKAWREERHWGPKLFALRVIGLLGLIAAGALVLLLFPGLALAAQSNIGSAPWASLGLGAAIVFAGPVVVLVFLITVIGIPIAFALLAAYAILWLIGYLTAAPMAQPLHQKHPVAAPCGITLSLVRARLST